MMNCRAITIILTVLVLSGLSTDARATGPRCKCISTVSSYIRRDRIKKVKIIPSGPHCSQIEIIATLANGKTCLNPDAPWVQKIRKRIRQRKY